MTMKIKTIGVLCLLAVMIAACSKEGNDAKNSESVMYVDAGAGLRMRSSADTGAAVILTIPNGSQVTVLEIAEPQIEISGKTGRWTKVQYQGKEGWVFGGFLSQAAPSSSLRDRLVQQGLDLNDFSSADRAESAGNLCTGFRMAFHEDGTFVAQGPDSCSGTYTISGDGVALQYNYKYETGDINYNCPGMTAQISEGAEGYAVMQIQSPNGLSTVYKAFCR
jgi:hypothetical protein